MNKQATITILGRIYSKKNSKQIRYNRKTSRHFLTGSDQYLANQNSIIWQCKACRTRFTGPVHITYIFYLQGKYDIDADNAQATVNDALQAAGIIDDDRNIVSGKFKKIKGCEKFTTKIIITKI